MAKIVISTLHPNSIETFTHNLTPEQSQTILGGVYPGIGLVNITDSAYLYDSPRLDRRYWAIGAYSASRSEGAYSSVDYSRSIYNKFLH